MSVRLRTPVAWCCRSRSARQPASCCGRAGVYRYSRCGRPRTAHLSAHWGCYPGRCRLGGQRHQPEFTEPRCGSCRPESVRSRRSWPPRPTCIRAGRRSSMPMQHLQRARVPMPRSSQSHHCCAATRSRLTTKSSTKVNFPAIVKFLQRAGAFHATGECVLGYSAKYVRQQSNWRCL